MKTQSVTTENATEIEKVTGHIPSIIAPEDPIEPSPTPNITPSTPAPEIPDTPQTPEISPQVPSPDHPEIPTELPPHIAPLSQPIGRRRATDR